MKIFSRNHILFSLTLILVMSFFLSYSNISYAQVVDTQSLIAQLQQKLELLKQELQVYLQSPVVDDAILSADVQVNDRVQATANVNVRSTPDLQGTRIAVANSLSTGTVLAGPSKMVNGEIVQQTQSANDTWWQVKYDNGVVGWTSSLWLRDIGSDYGGNQPDSSLVTCDSFTLTPPTVNYGEKVVATWKTSNADAVWLKYYNDQLVIKNNLPNEGSYTFIPDQTRLDGVGVFELVAVGRNNTQATCVNSVVIRFETKIIPPTASTTTDSLQKCELFGFTKPNVKKGQETTLNWKVINSSKVFISTNLDSTPIEYPTEGSLTFTADRHVTYNLTGVNDKGYKRVLCSTSLVVQDVPVVATTPICNSFSVTPAVAKPGENVTYNWDTTNAQKVYFIDSYGDYFEVPVDGSMTNSAPNKSGLFTLKIFGFDGTNVGCSAFLVAKYK